ncbi:MAG: acyltransferase [Brevundimonas sp.]|nr:acyltransferase [Brevundimonas sp.]
MKPAPMVSGLACPGGINRDNNFDIIRLLAALQVAILHSNRHLQAGLPPELVRFLELFPGVPIFFFISGLLVTSSLATRPLKAYAESRARRIIPALWLAFVLGVLVLAAFGQIGGSELVNPVFWAWVVGQLTVFQVFNPEMFRDFGVGVLNGSLWTIPVEVGFYFILPVLAWLAARGAAAGNRARLTLVLFAAAIPSFVIYLKVWPTPEDASLVMKLISVSPAPHFWQFALGALTYLHLDRVLSWVGSLRRIPFGWLAPVLAYALAGALVAPLLPESLFVIAAYPLLMFGLLAVALVAPSRASVLRGWDISYGLYLFHMLFVNIAVALGYAGHWPAAVVAVVAAIVMAGVSWRGLESRILKRGRK